MPPLFNFEIKGTRLRPIFQFKSSIIQDKITTWHVSANEIRCSEISSNSRILFEYFLDSKTLVDYEYNYPEPMTKLKFELKWIIDKMQEVKIKDRVRFTIMSEDPETMEIKIFGNAKSRKDKLIQLTINPDINLQVSPDIYHSNPITMHKDDFMPFLKIKPQTKIGKLLKEEILVKIQAPNYLKFSRLTETNESEKYGSIRKDVECFKGKFYINEIKNIIKLSPSTNIFNIYQPVSDDMPLKISGLSGDFGFFTVYILPTNCEPIKETTINPDN
jgi:hypothetical protein